MPGKRKRSTATTTKKYELQMDIKEYHYVQLLNCIFADVHNFPTKFKRHQKIYLNIKIDE